MGVKKLTSDWINIAWCGPDGLNGFQFEYSPSKGVLRVSYFVDGHFKDEGFCDLDWHFTKEENK